MSFVLKRGNGLPFRCQNRVFVESCMVFQSNSNRISNITIMFQPVRSHSPGILFWMQPSVPFLSIIPIGYPAYNCRIPLFQIGSDLYRCYRRSFLDVLQKGSDCLQGFPCFPSGQGAVITCFTAFTILSQNHLKPRARIEVWVVYHLQK